MKLVSLVTPCYNVEKYIHRLLDSILCQTYPNVEMIVINDGSTDNTCSIIESYRNRITDKGYHITIINQSNKGQSEAINAALPLVKGDYLIWPDGDDWFSSNESITKMVNVMDNLPDGYAMARFSYNVLEDDTFIKVNLVGGKAKHNDPDYLFLDCLFSDFGGDFWFGSGSYIVDFSLFKKVNGLTIATSKNAGQNWQLLLPLLYHYKCLTVEEPLYNVVRRNGSHNRGQYRSCEQLFQKEYSFEKVLLQTLLNIKGMPDKDTLLFASKLHHNYIDKRYRIACREQNLQCADSSIVELKSEGMYTVPRRIRRIIAFNSLLRSLYYSLGRTL